MYNRGDKVMIDNEKEGIVVSGLYNDGELDYYSVETNDGYIANYGVDRLTSAVIDFDRGDLVRVRSGENYPSGLGMVKSSQRIGDGGECDCGCDYDDEYEYDECTCDLNYVSAGEPFYIVQIGENEYKVLQEDLTLKRRGNPNAESQQTEPVVGNKREASVQVFRETSTVSKNTAEAAAEAMLVIGAAYTEDGGELTPEAVDKAKEVAKDVLEEEREASTQATQSTPEAIDEQLASLDDKNVAQLSKFEMSIIRLGLGALQRTIADLSKKIEII